MVLLSVTRHATMRARQRLNWDRRKLIDHWHSYLSEGQFDRGDGIYQIVAGGIVFIVSRETMLDEVRIITVHEASWFDRSRWLQPLYG